MRKLRLLFCFFVLLCTYFHVNAQGNCPWHVNRNVIEATCLNNGGVEFFLLTDNGDTIAIDIENKKPVDPSINLSEIKFYHQSLTNVEDTTTYYTPNPRIFLKPGTYRVGVQAQCYNGGEGSGAYTPLSYEEIIDVVGSYTVPTVAILANTATNSWSSGNRPTVPCGNTGRIQLKIINGSMPYSLVLVNSATKDTVRTKYITRPEGYSTDTLSADFKDLYTFDTLPAGSYRLYFSDACDFKDSAITWTVENIKFPQLTSIHIDPVNYDYSSGYYNIFRFSSTYLSPGDVADYLYNYYAQNMQYRVCYGTKDTSDWKPFPIWNANIQNDNRYYIGYDILDTAHHISKYCEIEGEYLTFQYRTTSCIGGDTVNLYTYRIQPYMSMYTTTNEDIDFQSVYYDSCTYHIPGVHKHTLNIKSDWWHYSSWSLQTNAPSSDESWNNMYHRYVTMPITYTLKDTVTGQVIKTQTVNNINRWTVDISDIEAVYGDITGNMQLPLKLERTDSKGCVVSNNNEIHVYDQNQTIDGNHWLSYNHDYYGYTCCSRLSNFNIFETFNANREQAQPIPQRYKQTRDGAKFQITKSPRRNKYNMTATYHYDTDSWTVEKESEFNNAEITSYENEGYDAENNNSHYYWGVRVEDYCIPYGQYNFRLITDCDTQTYNGAWLSNNYERRIKYEKPAYTTTQECDNYYITLEAGQCKYNLIGSTSDEFQDELIVGEGTMSTFFKIISGPANGYPTNDFQRGETIRLTIPGTYTLRMYSPDNYCESAYFDTTITYTGGTVSFDYAYAYVCDADSTVGFFYCQAKDGMAPYHYSLYELTNMEGNLLEENNTGSFKGLSNIHVGDMMSLEVGDACGRSYYVNITVTDLSSSRLAWFDGALRVTETCEGSEIDVYISAVEEDFTYHWTGPNGFDVTTPRGHIVIGRGSEPGDYTVEIGNTGCSQTLKDTVTLGILPAPKVEMSSGTNTVCPGQNVTLSFTPTQGTGTITYIIGREINSIDTFYNFSGIVGETASLEYTATSEATFWIHKVEDEICNYTIPEDTVKITLRDAATACDVTVTDLQVCYGVQAVLTASSTTMQKPYTIKWYDNPYQQNVLKTEVIEDGMPDASFTTGRLYADSTLYVTIQDATHCETYTGTVNQWMNMADGNTDMICGQSIRLFDDGGSNGNYLPSKYYKHTFTSTDGNLITLSFNSFNTQLNGDVMRVYTGDEVLQDSLLALISGSNLPESLTSNGTSMTIVFVSNSATEAEGWDALVSCSALPAQAKIKVLEDLSVSLSISPELPARYDQSYTLTAVANGGQGSRYEFTWHITDKDYYEIQSSSHELASNTDIYNLDNLTETRNVWVVVKDMSDDPCTKKDKMSNLIQIEIADIALNLELSSTVNEICQGDIPMIVKIKNDGSQTARNVKVKLALPNGMSLTDEADSLILFPEINAQGTVYDTLFIRNEAHVSTSTSMDIRAQIWSCDQGDNNSNWHNWDWTGNPNEADESIYTFTIRPSLDIVNAPGLTVSSADICFGGDATIQAHSNLDYPQHFIWYADAALTQVIKDTTLENNTSIIVSNEFTNITQEGALCYVMVENSNYCPAYTTVDYRTKMQYAPTDTILMHNGSSMVGNTDHIRFFDDGGADNNYAPNKRYGYLFTSVDGSPLAIYFDENNYIYNYNNYARIEIYDGESDMTPRLARYTSSQMRDKVLVATTGKMFIKFYSDDYTERGISAHVFTTSRAMVAEADVTFKTPMAAENITTSDDQVCYGENATLTASAPNLAFPQTHYWYDENLNPVDTITVEAADAHSTLPISSVTSASNYYVTVSNADECPVVVPVNSTSTEREVRLNAEHDGETTIVTPNETINFYDEGGRNNSFTTHGYKHTFTTTQGKLKVSFPSSYISIGSDTLYLYDGEDETAPLLSKWTGNNNYEYSTYTSSGLSLTFKLYGTNHCCPSGWRMQIRSTNPESSMAVAKASVKAGAPESITTDQEVAVCYGSDAVLNASSSLSTYPQYFYWYNADRTEIVHRDIVENPGESSSYSFTPTSETFYYVTVTNSDNCPIDESQLPQDTDNLIKIKVTFSEPVISNNVTVNDDVVCYGQNASLTATTNDGTEKHIYWYDENFHLINDEIGTSSTFEPQVSGTTVYYVNAVETNQCGILPPSYGKFFFDASKNGGTTNLTTGEMIPFYDAGGPNANYNTPGADWTHTFVAPAGKQVTLKMNSYYTSGHRLFIYDGNTNNLRREFNGNYGENMNVEPITSTTGKLIVRWFIDYNPNNFNYPGWEGEIGVLDANGEMHVRDTELATAHVSMKSIADQLASITTTDATVCYGSQATLTASSTIDYPQTFYWFNSSRDSILRQQTIDSGHDSFTTLPTTEGSYYVYVTNSQNCPLPTPIHDEHIIVNMGNSNTNSYSLTEHNIIDFYDAGGINDNYNDCWGGYYYFNAPVGTRIHIHFNNIQLEENSYLQLALSKADNNSYEHKELRGTLSDTDFVSEGNYVQIYFWNSCNEETAAGWDGYIYAETPIDIENLVAANVTFEQPTFSQNVSTTDVEACYGDEITLTASNIGSTSRYAWYDENYNLIKDTIGVNSQFSMIANSNTTYYVNASAANECPVIPPSYNGNIPQLTAAHVTIKAPVEPSVITTTDGVACYGQPATLTANADIDYPQYYTWYDEDYTELYFDTLYSNGEVSSYTVPQVTGHNDYYVAVSNADNCSVVFSKEVLLNESANGGTTILDGQSNYRFCDEGGSAGYYNYYNGWYGSRTHTFTNPSGQVYVTFDRDMDFYDSDRLYIYDGTSESDEPLYTVTRDVISSMPLTFQSNSNSLTFKFDHYSWSENKGWSALVAAVPIAPNQREIRLNRNMNNQTTTVNSGEVVNFYDEGGANSSFCLDGSNNGSITHTFTAASGKLQIAFKNYVNLDAIRMLIYDGTEVNSDNLIKEYNYYDSWNSDNTPVFTSSGSSLTIKLQMDYSWNTCSEGWRAEITTTVPDLAIASTSVKVVDPATIATTDAEICYGDSATLTASSEIGVPQYYFWYGPDRMDVVKYDTVWTEGTHSEFSVLTGMEETYYVTVTNDTTCPFVEPIHNHVKNVVVAENFQTRSIYVELASNDSVVFYDAGGPDGNIDFRNNNNSSCWDQSVYFTAENGSYIHVHLDYLDGGSSDARFSIYDEENGREIAYFRKSAIDKDYVIKSTRVRLSFSNDCDRKSFPGWLGSVYAVSPRDVSELAEARVRFKTPVGPSSLTTNSPVKVCYGSEATLTASSTLDADQYFTWYDSDRINILKRDTIHTQGQNSWVTLTPEEEGNYYVAVTNANNCPIIENLHTHYAEVLIGNNYQLLPYDSIGFFDDGGRNNNYAANSSSRSSNFTAEDGSHIRIHIDTISLSRRAYLRIRDEENNLVIATFNGPIDTANLDYIIESNRVYCYFDNDKSNLTAMGWEGYVYAITPHNEEELVEVNIEFMDPDIVDANDVDVTNAENVCYGETVTLTATVSGSEPQHFVWYDEESNIVNDEIRTGSSSFTVVATEEAYYYVNVSSTNECPVLSPDDDVEDFNLPYGHISLKAGVLGAEITTTDDEVCFGSEATLTATSDIDFPQYYTWYAPDRITILKQETVTAGGHSTLTVTPDEETDYYVAITNDENCPIVEQIHNRLVEVMMNNQNNSYDLSSNDSVRFYDTGGKDGDYWTDWGGDFYFNAEEGSHIRIHFDTVQLARNAYIQIYNGDNSNNPIVYITGSRGNLDTIVESNRVRIYFSGYSNTSAPGWEAYVYALNPRDEDELASAHVSFMRPSINNNLITTTNAEGCYSATDTVKAVSTLTENQYFAWYDNDMNLLKQEVIPSGEYSELPVEVLANTTYYVNVSTENECPVLPPHYGEFWFNSSVNGGTTNLALGEAIPFYDAAGPDGNYNTPGANWTHTFVAPVGKTITVQLDRFESMCGHRLEFYEGTTTDNSYQNNSPFRTFNCCCYNNNVITSSTNILTVRWYISYDEYSFGNYRGWEGLVGVQDAYTSMSVNSDLFAEAHVNVTAPTWNLPVTTTNDTVCYGDAAYLTANSTIDYPQYYLWYAPDARTILLRDTIDGVIKTESEFNAPYYYHYQDQTYYVAIGNGDNCPPVMSTENEPRTVLLNAAAHEQTTILGESDAVKFYDAGGLNDSYHDHNSDYTHTFQATHGTLMVQFRDNNMDIYRYDTLYVYDSDHADETRLIGKVINDWDDDIDQRVMNYDNLRYYSTGQYLTFRFQQGPNNNWYSGWNATVMPYNLENDMATAEVNVKISSVPEMAVTTVSDTVCYGSAATVSASADLQYPQYYTWYNSQMEVLQKDTLFDASETESVLNLPAQYRNETYYAYIYSDTVSCIMDMEAMPKQYSELYLNTSMDGGTTVVHPYDSIGFFSDGTLQGSNNRSLDMDYYFTAESGLIQIHFDELELTYETYMEFIDDGYDIDFMEIGENTFYDITITSLSNTLHLDLDSKSSDRASARWSGTITNINVVNSAVLSKMAQANVAVEINNSVNTVTTTNDTVCIGSPAMLTASSDIAYPQYYTWYNDDLSSILFEDTIASGSSNFYIPGQVGNAIYHVIASNDTTCTLRPVTIHNNFREYIFDADMNGHTIFVGATDSVVIYDDGGKDGDYTIPEDERILIMKMETYPGATLNFRIPMAQLYQEDDDLELVIVEPDENGNIGEGSIGVMIMGSINDEISYTTSRNVAFIGWIMYGTDLLPMPGFEMVVTADLHPEQHLAEAQVIMKSNLPMDYNALTNTTSTVICQGDNAELEATSNLTENPQYFLWYSSDLSRVIGADTVYSGSVSHVSIPNLMQDTLLYVAVGTDEVCPAYPMEHKLISEIKLNTLTNAHTTYLSAVDSVLFYDDGGKNNRYTFQNGYLYRTFKASSGHVVFNLHELSITDCDDENFLGVLDGEFDIQNVDEDSIRAMYYAEEIPAGDSIIISTGNTLSIIFVSDHMHEDEPNNGWFASIYTTEQMSSDMGTVTPAEVTVNPSYQFDVYDTTNASRAPYSTADNMFRNIDVSAEGELIIDSVFHTALGCDSTYTLHLMVLPPTVQDIIIASHSNSWTYDGWYHREEVYTVVYGLDTLTADAGSDGKVFTMPGTGDVLTITPDATAEVIYFTPTPVPNSFSYTLDNEADYPSVTTDTGTLGITPIATEITITANSASKYYDGTPLTNDGFTYTPADILVEGDTLVAEIVGTITEIGDSLNRVVSYQVLRNVNFNRRGLASYTQDVTNCYTFALPVSGTLSIVDTFTVSCEVVNGGRICPGSNDGTATITIEGGKDVSPDRYEYSIVGDNTGYNNTGHTEGEIILNTLSPDSYTVTATDALGLTATATFSIVERPVITTTTVFECPNNIDTVIKHSGCNITLMDIGTPNFVAPTGMDMADVTIYNNAPADHIYEVGETTVTWVAKGMCGDSVTCDQIIKVSFQSCPDAVDFEGNSYPSVRLGSGCKCWTTENLVSTKYSDGRDIDDVMDYYSYEYPDVATNVSIFGHLYNWYAAADTARYGSVDSVERAYQSGNHIQGICPDGWYLPSDEEYDELNIYPTTDLRSTEYWIRVNGVVNTNATGFNSLPGGMYNCSTGRFESMMGNSYYWTCHPVYDLATGAMIDYICEKIVTNNNSRCNGYSIRCIWGE